MTTGICAYCKNANPDLIVEKDIKMPDGTTATLIATLHAKWLVEWTGEEE